MFSLFCVFSPKHRHHPEPKHKHHPEPKHRHHTEGDSYAYVKYLKINKYARAYVRTTRVAAFEVKEIRRIQASRRRERKAEAEGTELEDEEEDARVIWPRS